MSKVQTVLFLSKATIDAYAWNTILTFLTIPNLPQEPNYSVPYVFRTLITDEVW